MKPRNSSVIETSRTLFSALSTIGGDLKLDDSLNVASFETLINTVAAEEEAYNNDLVEISKKRIQLNDRNEELRNLQKRFRNGVKMKFVEESVEYETIGGTRPSQRKSYVRGKKNDTK